MKHAKNWLKEQLLRVFYNSQTYRWQLVGWYYEYKILVMEDWPGSVRWPDKHLMPLYVFERWVMEKRRR